MHLRIIVEVVSLSNLIHQCQMSAILSPALLRRVVDQLDNEIVRSTARLWIETVKDKTHYMMHLPHSDDKRSNEVETCVFAALAGQGILSDRVVTRDFGDGGEEQVSSIGQPVSVERRLICQKVYRMRC